MLIKFAVQNYRGFAQRIEWDLSRPSSYNFNCHAIKNGAVKNGIVYGPNGSGKTNLGMAMFDIVNHLSQKFKKPDYYRNFIFAGSPSGVVEFEYQFRFAETVLDYRYSKDREGRLVDEELFAYGEPVFRRSGAELFVSSTLFPMEPAYLSALSQNANNVSIVNVLLSTFPLPENHYLLQLRDFVGGMLWFRNLDIREFIGLETSVCNSDEYIIRNGLVPDFASFVESVSGQKFCFAQHQPSDKRLLCVYGAEAVPFSEIASTGTRSLMLLYFWIQKMKTASLVFIDEFDAFYHFELSFEVCKRLFALDCQVYASSHNTYLMSNDLLRPDCNFFLNNNVVRPLCDCTEKELRFAHNIEKIYRGKGFQI